MKSFSIACISILGIAGALITSQSLAESAKKIDNAVVIQALDADKSESALAIAHLRAQGMAGVDKFWQSYQQKWQGKTISPQNKEWQRWRAAFDAVCQQRDCYTSRLYWHTDLESAKKEAQATGKPILSLRLLGNLNNFKRRILPPQS